MLGLSFLDHRPETYAFLANDYKGIWFLVKFPVLIEAIIWFGMYTHRLRIARALIHDTLVFAVAVLGMVNSKHEIIWYVLEFCLLVSASMTFYSLSLCVLGLIFLFNRKSSLLP